MRLARRTTATLRLKCRPNDGTASSARLTRRESQGIKPASLLLATAILIGVAVGLGGYTFVYAKGYSYLANDPAVCANCHIMDEHYAAWQKSSHNAVAGCNDCHTPHDNLVHKYYVKAKNGFWHSFYFTTGDFPYPIRITEPNHEVVEHSCRYCHETITETIDHGLPAEPEAGAAQDCTHCHRYVGHLVR